MAFSLADGWSRVLGVFSLIVPVIGWLICRRYRITGLAFPSLMLMLGGDLGNAIDRLLRGTVTDMFQVLCFRFGIFNVADAALVIGALGLGISLLFRPGDFTPIDPPQKEQ